MTFLFFLDIFFEVLPPVSSPMVKGASGVDPGPPCLLAFLTSFNLSLTLFLDRFQGTTTAFFLAEGFLTLVAAGCDSCVRGGCIASGCDLCVGGGCIASGCDLCVGGGCIAVGCVGLTTCDCCS